MTSLNPTLKVLALPILFIGACSFAGFLPADAAEPEKCQISCIEPHAACTESEKVIETLKEITAALNDGDLETVSSYLDDGCTTFDKGTKKLIVGKQAVLDDLKRRIAAHNATSQEPLKAYTIDHPYAKVNGDVCVVTFVAHKEYGGKHPMKMESRCTDIFVRRGEKWKKLHYRSDWKRAK
ncbi:MAG TPA: nuclear transport factor 2 family protein [Candidatus Obscuribacterales bacterium]